MSSVIDDGLRVISRAGGGVPFTYSVSETGTIQVTSAHATFAGGSASGNYLPCLSFYSQNGTLLGRFFPDTGAVTQGSDADVSYGPFLGGGGSTVGAGLALIFSTVLANDAPSITIPNIPQNHTHIELYGYARTDRGAGSDLVSVQFNGDTGNNYNWEQLTGNNGVTDSFNTPTGGHTPGPIGNIALTAATASNAQANSFGTSRYSIMFYAQTTNWKMLVGEGGVFVDSTAAGAVRSSMTGIWRSAAAITSMKLFPTLGNNFKAGTSYQLYGI